MDGDSDDCSVACSDHSEPLRKNNQLHADDAEELLTITWVQCEKPDCLKWRRILKSEAKALGDTRWFCYMNGNRKFSSCDVPEEDFEDEEEMVEMRRLVYVTSVFPPGSLVWAKMPGYCWWPGMVVVDRSEDQSVMVDEDGDPLCYHVEFLGRKRTRAWIPEYSVEMYGEHVHLSAFADQHPKRSSNDKTSFNGQSVKEAVKEADSWCSLTLDQRLKKSQFLKITSVKNVPMICNESKQKRQKKRQILKSDDLENILSKKQKSQGKEDFGSDSKMKRPKNVTERSQLSSETEALGKDKETSEVTQNAASMELHSTSLEPQTLTLSSKKLCKVGEKEPGGSRKAGVGKKKAATVKPVAEMAEVSKITCTQDETLESMQYTRASASTDDASDLITENRDKASEESDNALKDLTNVRSNLGQKKSFCPPMKAKTTTEALTKKKPSENKETGITTTKILEKIGNEVPVKKISKKVCGVPDKKIPEKIDNGVPVKKISKNVCGVPDKKIPEKIDNGVPAKKISKKVSRVPDNEVSEKIDNGVPAKKISKKVCGVPDKKISEKIENGVPAKKVSKKVSGVPDNEVSEKIENEVPVKKISKKICGVPDNEVSEKIDNGVPARKISKKGDIVVTRKPSESEECQIPAMKSSEEKDADVPDGVDTIESGAVEDELNLYLSESEPPDNADQHGNTVKSDFEDLAADNFSECGNEEKSPEKTDRLGRLLGQSASMIGRSKEEKYSIDVQMYLENHDRFERDIRTFMVDNGRQIHKLPLWENHSIRLFDLFLAVHEFGGYDMVCKKRVWTEIYHDLTGVSNAQSTAKIRSYYRKYLLPYELHINGFDYAHLFAKAKTSEAKQPKKGKKSEGNASDSQQMKKKATKDTHLSEDDADIDTEKAELEELMMDLDTYEALSQSQMAGCLSQDYSFPLKKPCQPPSSSMAGENSQDTEAVSALKKDVPQLMPIEVEASCASPVPSFGSEQDDPSAAAEMAALREELMSLQEHFDEMENIFYEH